MSYIRNIFSLVLLCFGSASYAEVKVVTSILPLQLIADRVTRGISTVDVILDGSQDPHHPSLRPSQRRLMNSADIFIWTGPALETGFE